MRDPMVTSEFDVVILGAGFAGICQARHLLLNLPGVRVALVDPGPSHGGDCDADTGGGLSEIGALFVNKELGLHDYMIENHAPKQGLSFHWPKRYDETDSLDAYFHVWVNRDSEISNFHVNRSKFEGDVLPMTRELGAVYVRGQLVDVELTPGDSLHTVVVQEEAGGRRELKARHVVDAAGRRFIIGNERDNLLPHAQDLPGADSGCASLRVRNPDPAVFHDGIDPDNTATSRFYCTNNWLGYGHSVWQIPSWNDATELSVGVVHHHDVIPTETLDGREKLYRFLEQNHNLLFRLVSSGEEIGFSYLPRVAHRSKELFSPDNWFVVGEAAHSFASLYSHDTTALSLAVESVTEIIGSKLRKEPDADSKRAAFNDFVLAYSRSAELLASHRAEQLGHASAMSWRVFFENMWWLGLHVPMYVGKWHLDPGFLETYTKNVRPEHAPGALYENVYRTLDEVVDGGLNIGLMDVHRPDQLGSYAAADHAGEFRYQVATEPKKCNVFREWKRMALYMAWWYARLQWRVRGMRGVSAPSNLRRALGLLRMAGVAGRHDLAHRLRTRGEPKNTVAARNIEESFAYRRQPVLQPWGAHLDAPERASESSHLPDLDLVDSQEVGPLPRSV